MARLEPPRTQGVGSSGSVYIAKGSDVEALLSRVVFPKSATRFRASSEKETGRAHPLPVLGQAANCSCPAEPTSVHYPRRAQKSRRRRAPMDTPGSLIQAPRSGARAQKRARMEHKGLPKRRAVRSFPQWRCIWAVCIPPRPPCCYTMRLRRTLSGCFQSQRTEDVLQQNASIRTDVYSATTGESGS